MNSFSKLLQPSLSRRIVLWFFIVNILVLLLALILSFYVNAFLDGTESGGEVAASIVFADLEDAGRLALPTDSNIQSLAERNPSLWFVARQAGRQLSFGPVPDGITRLLDSAPGTLDWLEMRMPDGSSRGSLVSLERRETKHGELTVILGGMENPDAVSLLQIYDYLYRIGAVWVIVVVCAISIPAISVVISLVLRGIRPLAEEAARITPADLRRRLPEKGVVKEMLPLVVAFNTALDLVEDAFIGRRRLIADVSHELRSPLAVLSMQVELLPAGEQKSELKRSIFRLAQMVGQILDVERLGLEAGRREPVDLVELTREAVADVAPLAVVSGYEIAVAIESAVVMAEVDRHAVARAIGNLLGNAVAHGGNNGLIEARVKAQGFVEVSDQGPGVPPDAQNQIFEPFWRGRRDRDGCGLGLHLVREIMTAHGGTIALVTSQKGSTFRLAFPINLAMGPRQ